MRKKSKSESAYNTKEFDKLKPKESSNGLKGLMYFLLVLIFMAVSTVSVIAGAYFSSANVKVNVPNTSSIAVNGEFDSQTDYIDTDYIVQVCVYNDESYRIASGMVISENGYILTCDHLFKGLKSPNMLVVIKDVGVSRAVYVGGDDRTDTAILKIEQRGLKYVSVNPSSVAEIGESVYVAECSQNDNASPVVTKGVLSSDKIRIATNTDYPSKMLQFDAAVNEGASGGALLNSKGQLIGMIAAKQSFSTEGVGYAVCTDTLSMVVDEIIDNGLVSERVRLGFTFEYISMAKAEMLGQQAGLRIKSVSSHSDLYQYGFNENDTITHVNSVKILSLDDFYDVIESADSTATLNLTVKLSNTEERQVSIHLLTEKGSNSYLP